MALAYEKPRGRLPTIEYVPLDELRIDDTYQRSIETKASQTLIGSIARGWDWDLFDVLKVSRRPDDSLFVVDGQHRLAAARLRDDISQLPCVLKRCAGPAEEAKLFTAANRGRKQMNRLDDFRAAAAAGDEVAATIERLIAAAGLTIARKTNPKGQAPGELAIVAPIRAALKARGENITGRALQLIGESFPDEVLINPAPLFNALLLILALTDVEYDDLFATLLTGTTADWSEWAKLSTVVGGQSRIAALRTTIISRHHARLKAAA